MLPAFLQNEQNELMICDGQLGTMREGVTRAQLERHFERCEAVKAMPMESIEHIVALKNQGYQVIKHTSLVIVLALGDDEYEFREKRHRRLVMVIFNLGDLCRL
jgi:hypothetical protein